MISALLRFAVSAIALLLLPMGVQASDEVVAGEYIIRLKPAGVNRVQEKLRGKAFLKGAFAGKAGTFHLTNTDPSLIQELQTDPDVHYVEPNYRLYAIEPEGSDDPVQALRDGLYTQTFANIKADQAWESASPYDENNRPIVAVIDTGIDYTHPVFINSNALWVNPREIPGNGIDDDFNGYVDDVHGWNFLTNNNNFMDDENHGTHVAGIVLGATQDIEDAPEVPAKIQIMGLKFLDKNGSGTTAAAVNAVYYAVDMGAKVINCSWGGGTYSRALHDALTYAYEKGVLVVTAAGNNTDNNDIKPMFPANYDVPSNVSVAATNDNDRLTSFSNYGVQKVHLAAPGHYVYSTLSSLRPYGPYGVMSGTSMAAPLVAGAAALALRESPDLTGYQLRSLILSTVDPVSNLSGVVSSGGRVNLEKMIEAAKTSLAVNSYQPSYRPTYLADRSVASESKPSGLAGCGTIQAVGSGSALLGGGKAPPGAGAAGLLLLLAPLALWFMVRQKAPSYRRRHERYIMNSNVVIKAGDREIVANLKTISMGGLSFNVDEALERGGSLQMKVLGPDGQTAIEVEGHIVWNESNQSYGVAFDRVRDQARETLFSWTRQLLKA